MSTINALLAVGFLVFLLAGVVMYGKQHGYTIEKMAPALGGATLLYIVVMFGFWYGAQIGWWSLGFSSSHVAVDDKFADSYSSVVSGNLLNSDGMSDVELSGDVPPPRQEDSNSRSSYPQTGPHSNAAIDPGAAVVEVQWPTPTPVPTPVRYVPTKPRDKMLVAWRDWFIKANYNRGNVDKTKIPAGVTCRVVKTSSTTWGGLRGHNIWTMRCFDPNNEDYGTVDIPLTKLAKELLGVAKDEGLVEGTGKWPNGFFIPEGQQSQAPAFAPGPAQARSSGDGPDAFPAQFSQWLVVDELGGLICVWEGGSKILAKGSRHRFDPRSIRDNVSGKIPRVEVLMSSQGATCWGEIWPGKSHIEN